MRRWSAAAATMALTAWTVLSGFIACVEANGATQREIQGRVESVNARSGRLVVVRDFRGKTLRVTLTATPASRVFTCADDRAGLDRVKAGMLVSAFYEVVGSDGIVNLIVIEPSR